MEKKLRRKILEKVYLTKEKIITMAMNSSKKNIITTIWYNWETEKFFSTTQKNFLSEKTVVPIYFLPPNTRKKYSELLKEFVERRYEELGSLLLQDIEPIEMQNILQERYQSMKKYNVVNCCNECKYCEKYNFFLLKRKKR